MKNVVYHARHYWNKRPFVEQFQKPEECNLLNVYLHFVQLFDKLSLPTDQHVDLDVMYV